MSRPVPASSTFGSTMQGEVAIAAAQAVAGLPWKSPVRVATTGNITIATALNAGDAIDGVTLVAGDRVLAWQQTAPDENGIYEAAATPVRTGDFDSSDEIVGSIVPVTAGSVYGGQLFRNTNVAAVVVDTDDITFALLLASASGVVDHGNMGAAETLDLGDGSMHRGTLDADCTITIAGFTVDRFGQMVVQVEQDGTGGWGITWDADVVFVGDDQPGQAPGDVTFFLLWSSEGDGVIYAAKIGAGGITVSDDGTPLAGFAESLNFVGAGVTATGSGTNKTVTIPGTTAAEIAAVSELGDHEHIIDVFNGDAATTVFELSQEPTDPEAVWALVASVFTAITVSGAMNTTITFGAAPGSGTGNVVIQYPAVLA